MAFQSFKSFPGPIRPPTNKVLFGVATASPPRRSTSDAFSSDRSPPSPSLVDHRSPKTPKPVFRFGVAMTPHSAATSSKTCSFSFGSDLPPSRSALRSIRYFHTEDTPPEKDSGTSGLAT